MPGIRYRPNSQKITIGRTLVMKALLPHAENGPRQLVGCKLHLDWWLHCKITNHCTHEYILTVE